MSLRFLVVSPIALVLAGAAFAAEPERIATLDADRGGFIASVQYSSDGKTIYTIGQKPHIGVWDAKSGKATRSIDLPDGAAATGLSADGAVAVGFAGKSVIVWDVATGKQQAEIKGHTEMVLSARLSPDGKRVVTASQDKTARVSDAKTGKLVCQLKGNEGPVASAEFNAEGTRVATGTYHGEVRVWDAKTGEELVELMGMSTSNNPTVFSADGKFVVSPRHESPAVWALKDGKRIQEFKGHKGWCRAAAFSPSGDRIASAGHDKTARVWDVKTGAELFNLRHDAEVRSAVFSPDGNRVLTVCEGKVQIWQLPAEK